MKLIAVCLLLTAALGLTFAARPASGPILTASCSVCAVNSPVDFFGTGFPPVKGKARYQGYTGIYGGLSSEVLELGQGNIAGTLDFIYTPDTVGPWYMCVHEVAYNRTGESTCIDFSVQ